MDRHTALIREWHGVSHRVTVLADGVLLRGARYRSLAEVARKITGTRWSGPRFFRLRAPITLSARPAECAESEGGKLFTLQEKQK